MHRHFQQYIVSSALVAAAGVRATRPKVRPARSRRTSSVSPPARRFRSGSTRRAEPVRGESHEGSRDYVAQDFQGAIAAYKDAIKDDRRIFRLLPR